MLGPVSAWTVWLNTLTIILHFDVSTSNAPISVLKKVYETFSSNFKLQGDFTQLFDKELLLWLRKKSQEIVWGSNWKPDA